MLLVKTSFACQLAYLEVIKRLVGHFNIYIFSTHFFVAQILSYRCEKVSLELKWVTGRCVNTVRSIKFRSSRARLPTFISGNKGSRVNLHSKHSKIQYKPATKEPLFERFLFIFSTNFTATNNSIAPKLGLF